MEVLTTNTNIKSIYKMELVYLYTWYNLDDSSNVHPRSLAYDRTTRYMVEQVYTLHATAHMDLIPGTIPVPAKCVGSMCLCTIMGQ